MRRKRLGPRWRVIGPAIAIIAILAMPCAGMAASGDRQIASGPYSLSIRAGGENNTDALGADGRIDYLNPLLNVHIFGTYDWLNAGRGEGQIDNKRFGAGLALSHTYAHKANAFLGTSFIREMGETFGNAYIGGKLKVADYAFVSATYGFGFGGVKEIRKITSRFVGAESVDWLKAGVVLVNSQGWKANAYYTLTDPGDLRISGIEGELSYPLRDSLFVGVNGSSDLTKKTDQERNWRTFAFLTYAFGEQKGNPIDVALDKNSPAEYPRIIRKLVRNAGPAGTLTVHITRGIGGPVIDGLTEPIASDFTQTFGSTVSGGSGSYSYSWTISSSSRFQVQGGTTASSATYYNNPGGTPPDTATLTLTVTDSANPSLQGSVSITLSSGGV